MSTPDIVAGLVGALVDVVEPLVDATTSVEAFEAFLLRLGWLRPDNQGYFTEVQGILDLSSELQAALDVVDELTGSDDLSEEELSNALNLGIAVIQKVQALTQFSPSATLPFPLNQSSFWSILADDLIGDLFGSYLQDRFPGVFALLLVLGIIEEQTFPADVANGRAGYTRLRVFWDRLPTLVSDPRQLVVNTYGWGGTFNHQLLLANVQRGVQELGPPIDRQPAFDPALANYYAPTNPALATIQQLKIPFFRDLITSVGAYAEMGLVTFPIPASGDINGGPVGVVITPYIHGSATATIALGSTLALTLSGGLELSGFSGIEIRPGDFGITLGTASGTLDVKAALTNRPSDPIVILGKVDSDHLLVSDLSVSLEVRGDPSAPEVVLALRTSGLELLFDPGSGDGFIQTLLGSDPIKAQADGGVVWSSKSGLTFEGTGTLKIDRSLRKTIGPFTLLGFSVEIQGGSDLELDVAVSGSGTLGPVTVTVQDIGGRLLLEPSAAGTPATQSFGNLNVDYGFKAPTGVGLSVDAGSVHGGGFISFDPAAGRYFGALQLSIYDIAVNAFGLIETKVPSVGYSFVIVISAQFTPIQLGFGFTLNGVGGIVGINRAIDTNALASLVRAGQSEELLFPKNVVADAPTIVRDLTTVFPATQGKYVFGPLGKLGWGTPTLITGEIGVILEYPALVVVILGEVKCLLPKPDAALVKLNLSDRRRARLPEQDVRDGRGPARLGHQWVPGVGADGDAGQLGEPAELRLLDRRFSPRVHAAAQLPQAAADDAGPRQPRGGQDQRERILCGHLEHRAGGRLGHAARGGQRHHARRLRQREGAVRVPAVLVRGGHRRQREDLVPRLRAERPPVGPARRTVPLAHQGRGLRQHHLVGRLPGVRCHLRGQPAGHAAGDRSVGRRRRRPIRPPPSSVCRRRSRIRATGRGRSFRARSAR